MTGQRMDVDMPATLVAADWGTPRVCARHGEQAYVKKRTSFSVPPSPFHLALLVIALLLFALPAGLLPRLAGIILFVVLLTRRRLTVAPGWPFCPACDKRQRTLIGAGVGLILLSALTGVDLMAVAPVLPLLPLGVASFVAGVIVLSRSTNDEIARGSVSPDEMVVTFRGVDQAFAAQVVATTEEAARLAAE